MMNAIPWNDVEVLSFDCYGTLIDWETGLLHAFDSWRRESGAAITDSELLAAFARWETRIQQQRPQALYPEILEAVLEAVSGEHGAPASKRQCEAFGASVGDWPAFPDSAPALGMLKRKYRLCILSNIDRESFRLSAPHLETGFDYILTAQDIGSYKPDPRNFRYMVEHLAADGIGISGVLHVAQSLYHDHAPARAAGLRSVWIDRRGGRGGGATPPAPEARPDARFENLADFAAALCG